MFWRLTSRSASLGRRPALTGDFFTTPFHRVFTDPAGGRVRVTQAIADHIIEDPSRQDGREAFFPFIPEILERPQEIWVGFARDKGTGRVALRRRYVRLLKLGKNRTLGLVADAEDGFWQGVTFFRGDQRGVRRLRQGVRLYREGE